MARQNIIIPEPLQIVGRWMRVECIAPRSRSMREGMVTGCVLEDYGRNTRVLINVKPRKGDEWSRHLTPLEFTRLLFTDETHASYREFIYLD